MLKLSSERRRMELPKKKEDLDKIVEEVEEEHEHEHVHEHHHEHENVEDIVSVLELLVDSLSANVKNIDTTVKAQGNEIINIYKILAYVVEACTSNDTNSKNEALKKAIELLK
ncbi:MAG: hypothetical protein ACP5L0_01445 [Caldisphaera sp.]|uniref:hypothetical protein n=1 Tax=Caldisphaera sp. TaxID=2060322 RepID=UPI0025BCB9B2|nr:hypothetical protein [Caldisphaera sp.]